MHATLSDVIADTAQNSIEAGAKKIEVTLIEDGKTISVRIKDNGKGMDEEFLKNVTSPFTTKRTTRKVGLGIPLLKMAAEGTGGGIDIKSEVGIGTVITATFSYNHIDRQPLGNIVDTVFTVITSYTETDFLFIHTVKEKEFRLDTREMREILGGVPFNDAGVMQWLLGYLKEGEEELYA